MPAPAWLLSGEGFQLATLEIAASAPRTTNSQSSAIPIGEGRENVAVLVDVTAVSGTTPSLALAVEWSHDGTTWFTPETADTFTAITAAAKKTKVFSVKGDYMRLAWTITGTTPSFTFSARLWLKQ